jgi:hypothetical protein
MPAHLISPDGAITAKALASVCAESKSQTQIPRYKPEKRQQIVRYPLTLYRLIHALSEPFWRYYDALVCALPI